MYLWRSHMPGEQISAVRLAFWLCQLCVAHARQSEGWDSCETHVAGVDFTNAIVDRVDFR